MSPEPDDTDMTAEEVEAAFERAEPVRIVISREEWERMVQGVRVTETRGTKFLDCRLGATPQ